MKIIQTDSVLKSNQKVKMSELTSTEILESISDKLKILMDTNMSKPMTPKKHSSKNW